MGQEPDRIRAEIEQTREDMSETVDALGYKADVKSRAKESIQNRTDSVKGSVVGVKDKVVGGTPDTEQVGYQARRAVSFCIGASSPRRRSRARSIARR